MFTADFSNLEECFGAGSAGFQHDGEDGEDDDLNGGAACVPVGSTDTELPAKKLILHYVSFS